MMSRVSHPVFRALDILAILALAFGMFGIGVDYSRSQIRDMAEQLSNEPRGTNSFSRCLTEMWEQSGELDPAWKGKRKWSLME